MWVGATLYCGDLEHEKLTPAVTESNLASLFLGIRQAAATLRQREENWEVRDN